MEKILLFVFVEDVTTKDHAAHNSLYWFGIATWYRRKMICNNQDKVLK